MENTTEEVKVPAHKSVQVAIAEGIANSGDLVRNIVIEELVTIEVEKRKTAVIGALGRLNTLRGDFKKIDRHDGSYVTQIGGERVLTYSEERQKAIKEGKEKIQKLETAIDNFLEKNDAETLEKMNQAAKGGGGGGDQDKKS